MNIPFTKFNNLGLAFSGLLLILSIAFISLRGLNFGLDFTGGISIEINYDEKVELEDIRTSLSNIEDANFVVLNFGSDDNILIKFQSEDVESFSPQTVFDQLEIDNLLGEVTKTEVIFPQIGEELRDNGGIAILVAIFAILVYIIFRFQYKFGVGAIAALVHDVLLILGLFSIFQLTFDLSVLAAVLAIVGYSLNDSIVVSDRIRENFLDQNQKGSSDSLINLSLIHISEPTRH